MIGYRLLIMQYILKTLTRLCCILLPVAGLAQSDMMPRGSQHQYFLDRLEIKQRDNNELNYSTFKPVSRKLAVQVCEMSDSMHRFYPYDYYYNLSRVDRYNLRSLLMDGREWVQSSKDSFNSKKPLWNTFYKDKANFLAIDQKDFFLAINPVLQLEAGFETANSAALFLNSKGITLRGMIGKSIGFNAYITDNQERGPEFFRERIAQFDAVPGEGFYKPFKTTAVDYLDARGSIFFNAGKYFDFQFGYDKNFIGNGYRSLFLSDFGNSNLFFRMNAHVWKLSYNVLISELVPQTIDINAGNKILDKKYAAMHHLSINATKWLNLGLFDAVIFGRANHFEFSYLNPVIFLRAAEQQNGSADNALLGIDYKANAGHQGQFYGQFMIDEFVLKEMRAGNGFWGNKFGVQTGAKYYDAFEVDNLDLQAEFNVVRPFTYSHFDSVANYSHYNQPLAHPLGANFSEVIISIRYQPLPKWTGELKTIYWRQGVDSTNSNFGSDIFKLNSTRSHGDYGYSLLDGVLTKAINISALLSFEWKHNLFVDGSLMYRHYKPENAAVKNTLMFMAGIRLNMTKREYDY
jgi:hypothetical protein